MVLLDAALRHAVRNHDVEVDRLLGIALEGFRARDNQDGEHVVLALRLIVANSHGDLPTIARLAEETEGLSGIELDPTLRALAPAVAANVAHFRGDVVEAAAILEAIPLPGVPPTIAEALLRQRWHMLMLSGRSEAAARSRRRPAVRSLDPERATVLGPGAVVVRRSVRVRRPRPLGPGLVREPRSGRRASVRPRLVQPRDLHGHGVGIGG